MHVALDHRARGLAERLIPRLPASGEVLDVGAGTGHNAAALRRRTDLCVRSIDVADLGVVGPPPTLFDGRNIPFGDGVFSAGTMLFVLSFVTEPETLLVDLRRVIDGPLLLLQTTVDSPAACAVLRMRGWAQGRLAFEVARWTGFVSADTPCTVNSPRLLSRVDLDELFHRAGWHVAALEPEPWLRHGPSRDLWVLEQKG